MNTAISIKQPWSWLIVNGYKDIENRTWNTLFRGDVLIHASKGMTKQEYRDACNFLATDSRLASALKSLPLMKELQRGGIVGRMKIVDCVSQSASPWFVGPCGFVIESATSLPFQPCKGALGFFDVRRFLK